MVCQSFCLAVIKIVTAPLSSSSTHDLFEVVTMELGLTRIIQFLIKHF